MNSPLLKTAYVMQRLGYKDRGAFWDAVHRHRIPHVRINARNVKFPEAALEDWIRKRSIGCAAIGSN